jgi:ectoine hydroxylase-related dioxygenase (phytanoyl-CoA dioxygenase family)
MTDEQRLFFEAQGYLVLPGVLSGDLLAQVRAAADRAEEHWRSAPDRPGLRTGDLLDIIGIVEYDPLFLDLMEHPAAFPLVRELLGDDVALIDDDYFITPPLQGALPRNPWHHDESLPGVYSPRSTIFVRVFYALEDVAPDGGTTAFVPGSHRFPAHVSLPVPADPEQMPGAVRMSVAAGTAYLFNGRLFHSGLPNHSRQTRRILSFNYGHLWMKPWPGYEPSERLRAAPTAVLKQLLHAAPAYISRLRD